MHERRARNHRARRYQLLKEALFVQAKVAADHQAQLVCEQVVPFHFQQQQWIDILENEVPCHRTDTVKHKESLVETAAPSRGRERGGDGWPRRVFYSGTLSRTHEQSRHDEKRTNIVRLPMPILFTPPANDAMLLAHFVHFRRILENHKTPIYESIPRGVSFTPGPQREDNSLLTFDTSPFWGRRMHPADTWLTPTWLVDLITSYARECRPYVVSRKVAALDWDRDKRNYTMYVYSWMAMVGVIMPILDKQCFYCATHDAFPLLSTRCQRLLAEQVRGLICRSCNKMYKSVLE